MCGVVIAHDVTNRLSPDDLIRMLRDVEESVRGRVRIEHVAEHPRIKSWRDAYRAFGAKPSEFRASIEALVRRVLRNDPLPSINALVDIGNLVSLQHLVPAGGHAIDVLPVISLCATGREVRPIRFDQVSTTPGEAVFVEGDTVLTRRWTWRQGNHTLTRLTRSPLPWTASAGSPRNRGGVRRSSTGRALLRRTDALDAAGDHDQTDPWKWPRQTRRVPCHGGTGPEELAVDRAVIHGSSGVYNYCDRWCERVR
jgi:DNA/RNA-binding domain of Phe-tRNA-synthetase-like protein